MKNSELLSVGDYLRVKNSPLTLFVVEKIRPHILISDVADTCQFYFLTDLTGYEKVTDADLLEFKLTGRFHE
jgi:hypothetical protein